MKRLLNRSGVALAIASAVASAFALTGCGPDGFFKGVGYGKYSNADRYSVGNFTYSAEQVSSIDMDWVKGDITFVVTDGDTLSVTETSDNLEDKKKIHWYIDGSTLMIKFWQSGLHGTVNSTDKRVTVEIPQSLESFVVYNTSGNINAQALSAASVYVGTTSGDIKIDAVTAEGKAKIESTSGKVGVGEINGSEVQVDTTSGDIELSKVASAGKVSVDSTSGDIKINELKGVSASVDTTSGDITVSSAVVEGEYRIDTTSGSLNIGKINAGSLALDTTSGDANIVIEKLGSGRIDSTSGDISLSSLGQGLTVKFDTSSGKLVTVKEHTVSGKSYIFGDGECKLTIDTSSGDLLVR